MKIPPNHSDYEVGFGKPPKATQFKSGQSGNPRGRSKKQGPATFEQVVVEEFQRPVRAQVNDKMVSMTAMKVLVRRTITDGIKGEAHARREALKLIEKIPDDILSGITAAKKKAMAEKIFEVFDELERYKRQFGDLPPLASSIKKNDAA